MHIYLQIYEFAASAGALEGYVYQRPVLDMAALKNWVGHIVAAYGHLPAEAVGEFQPSLNQTLGRAARSLESVLGADHTLAADLRSLIRGPLPASPDDFQKRKWFE